MSGAVAPRLGGYGQRGLRIPTDVKDANGAPLCRWCHAPVPKPRRAWCSDQCVAEFNDRSWEAISAVVRKRDMDCQLCGAPDLGLAQFEVDHIIPVADGGTDDPNNLRLLCRPCHVHVTTEWRRTRATPKDEETGHG